MTTACCSHLGRDHGRGNTALAGDRCSMPGCKCPGWIPLAKVAGKHGNGKPKTSELAKRIQELRAQGLTATSIRERLGCSYSQVTRALRGEA